MSPTSTLRGLASKPSLRLLPSEALHKNWKPLVSLFSPHRLKRTKSKDAGSAAWSA